jgi:DNA polymerase IV
MGPIFVEALPVGSFHGVGPATEAKMHRLGIQTGADLKAQPLSVLEQHFSKAGPYFQDIARGIDHRPVRPDRVHKSAGAENTFARDLFGSDEMRAELQPILDKIWRWCESTGIREPTVTLKVKYADFRQITRSRSLPHDVGNRDQLERISLDLPATLTPTKQGVRLLGVTLSALGTEWVGRAPQLSFVV